MEEDEEDANKGGILSDESGTSSHGSPVVGYSRIPTEEDG